MQPSPNDGSLQLALQLVQTTIFEPSHMQPLELDEEPEEDVDEVDDVLLPQTRWFMLHKEVPGTQQVDVPPVQVGTKLSVLQEAVSPFGQILPDVQSWHV